MMRSLLTCTMTFARFVTLILTVQTGSLSHLNVKRLGARLGGEVTIPCTDHHAVNHQDVFQWFYRKDSQSKPELIYHNDKSGLTHTNPYSWREYKTLRNFSLVIKNFKEDDQGNYYCHICTGAEECTKGLETSLFLIQESPPGITQRVYVAEGGNFTHPCPGGAGGTGPSASWMFQCFGETSSAPWPHQRGQKQLDGSMHIRDVQASDAGTYSCVKNLTQTLLSLSLCVLTARPVASSHSRGSPLNCSVHCEVGRKPDGLTRGANKSSKSAAVVVETGRVTFHVYEPPGKHEGTAVCHANDTGESGVENSTLPLDTENNQEDKNATPLALVLYVSLASSLCMLAIFLGFVFLCRQRLIAACPTAAEPSGDVHCPIHTTDTIPETGEEQTIYHVLEFKKDCVLVQEDGCVYSTIENVPFQN